MDYTALLGQYGLEVDPKDTAAEVERARKASEKARNAEVYKLCFACLDLTSLGATDSEKKITEFARKAADMHVIYPSVPDVASMCVFPSFVNTVGLALGDSSIAITSVSAGFPASQTFLEVKVLETAMAVEEGANEIDIVLNLGQFLSGEVDAAGSEIELLRSEAPDVVLKVIVESGAIMDHSLIRKASLLAMHAGADFVKTSTGKIAVAATPEAAVVMCRAIRDYHEKTGRKVGFKAAGGVATPEDAALYYTIVEQTLGREWLSPTYFRIGASSAANNLLTAIEGKEIKYF